MELVHCNPKYHSHCQPHLSLISWLYFFLNVRYMNIEIFAQWLTACKVVDILVHLTAMRHPTVEVPNSVYWMLPTGFSTTKMKLMFENFFWWRYGAIWMISKLIQVPSFYNKNNWYRITTGTKDNHKTRSRKSATCQNCCFWFEHILLSRCYDKRFGHKFLKLRISSPKLAVMWAPNVWHHINFCLWCLWRH